MFGSEILEVGIGLVVLFLAVSLVCSAFKEFLDKIVDLRAKTLEEELLSMIKDPEVVNKILENPVVKDVSQSGLFKKIFSPGSAKKQVKAGKTSKKVTWISAYNFAKGLVNAVNEGKADEIIDKIPNAEVQKVLKEITAASKKKTADLEETFNEKRVAIEKWFDERMEKLSSWYKSKSRQIILVFSILICLVFNLDSISISRSLYYDNTMRDAVVQLASSGKIKLEDNGDELKDSWVRIEAIRSELQGTGIPLLWNFKETQEKDPRGLPAGFWSWVLKVIGLLLTILATTMGAPFWYDILQKMVALKSSGKKPEANSDNQSG